MVYHVKSLNEVVEESARVSRPDVIYEAGSRYIPSDGTRGPREKAPSSLGGDRPRCCDGHGWSISVAIYTVGSFRSLEETVRLGLTLAVHSGSHNSAAM